MLRTMAIALAALAGVSGTILAILLIWPVPAPDPQQTFDFSRVEAPPEARPHTDYPARDGTRLPLRVYPAATAEVVFILIHGSAGHGDYLHAMATELAERDVATVYVPDLRGHGADPARRGDIDYVSQLEHDLVDLVAYAREQHPGARVVVGGHSAGGGLALRFAGGAYADGVDAWLLIAPLLGPEAPTARHDAGGWVQVRLPRIVALTVLNNFGITALDHLAVVHFNLPERYRTGRETLAYSWRMVRGFGPRDYRRDLAAVDEPVLLVIGERDEAFVVEQYAPVMDEYAPHGRVVVIPALRHMDIVSDKLAIDLYAEWLGNFARPGDQAAVDASAPASRGAD